MSDEARRPGGDGSVNRRGPAEARGSTAEERSPYYPPRREPLRAPWNPEDTGTGRRRSVPGGRDHFRRQGPIGRFVNAWGWRAYAIPVLLVLTVLVIVDAAGDAGVDNVSATDRESARETVEPPRIPFEQVPDVSLLPPGIDYEDEGSGSFRVVPGATDRVGGPEAELFTYTVEVEDNIDTVPFGGDDGFARMVDTTLSSPNSWTADDTVAFQRVGPDEAPDFRVTLTAPFTVRERCGYTIEVEASCFNPVEERAFINISRWTRGAHSFEGDIGSYRQYVINHEVGHAIGYPDHVPCPADGDLAPIMMQQTLSVRNSDIFALTGPDSYVPDNDDTCRPNAWPFAQGASNPAQDPDGSAPPPPGASE